MARKKLSGLYVAEIKSRHKDRTYTSFLLRRSYREAGKVKQQTLANLSHLPVEAIYVLRDMLRGRSFVPQEQALEVVATRSHGHVAAVGTMVDRLDLPGLLDPQPSAERDLVRSMIVARVVDSQSKLATTRWWQTTSLTECEPVARATEDDLYAAMDWLLERQERIEKGLARRHLQEGGLVLYDLSSSYVEGSHCPLADFGHNRDGKVGKQQVNYGLMLDAVGRPVAVEVYRGNTSDPKTVADQVKKLQERFRLRHVVLAGDRGMLTGTEIGKLKALGGIDWISALRAKEIQALVSSGSLQLSVFDQRDLMEVASPDFPGERLIVCRNPLLAEERAKHREALLQATERELDKLVRRVAAGRLKKQGKIGEALGRIKHRFKVGKHFVCEVAEGRFAYRRNPESIQREAEVDGFYVVRTSVGAQQLPSEQAVRAYKSLSNAEQAFRSLKRISLRVRPIYHWTEKRVRAHILLCLLAYYVEWHLRQAWAPFLFEDESPGAHEDDSIVRPALRSSAARRKALTHHTPDGKTVHSLRTLLADLGTIARNTVRIPAQPERATFTLVTTPTPFQREVCAAVGLSFDRPGRQNHPA